jgi:hypothetical protein
VIDAAQRDVGEDAKAVFLADIDPRRLAQDTVDIVVILVADIACVQIRPRPDQRAFVLARADDLDPRQRQDGGVLCGGGGVCYGRGGAQKERGDRQRRFEAHDNPRVSNF